MFQLALSAFRPGRDVREIAERDGSRRRRRKRLNPGAEALEVRDCPSGAAAHLGVSETAHALVATRHAAVQKHHHNIPMKRSRQNAPQTIFVSPRGKAGATAGKNAAHPASLAVALKRAKAGATIVLAPGVYTQAAGLMGKSGVTIEGAAGGGSVLAGAGNYALKIYSSSGITLNNVTLRSPNGSGLAVYGSSVNLVNVSAVGNHKDGVDVAGGGSVNATSSHFDSSQVGDGMDVQSGLATITGSTFNGNGSGGGSGGGSGLSVEGNSQVTVTNSQLNGNLNTNLVVFNQANVTAQGDTFNSSQKGNGAIFSQQSTANLTGNTFASNGQIFGPTTGFNGIEFFQDFTGNATVSGNTFSGNTASGIYIGSSSSPLQVTGNTFNGNLVGLNMDASAAAVHAVVQGNTFQVTPGSSFQGLDAAGSGVTATIGGSDSAANTFEDYGDQASILQFHVSAGKSVGCPNLTILGNSYLSNGRSVGSSSAILPC